MPRWLVVVACAVGVMIVGSVITLLSCRSSNRAAPVPGVGRSAVAILPASPPVDSSTHRVDGNSPTAPTPQEIDDPKMVLASLGLAQPITDDQLLVLMRRLAESDDAEVRRILVALFDVLAGANTLSADQAKVMTRKWDIPEEFGARLLRLAMPLLDRTYSLDPPEDDLKFLTMAMEVMERMRYAPALREMMRPEGVPAFGSMTPWTWSRFGDAAVQPLVEYAREQDGPARDRALRMLGSIRDPAATPALQRLLESTDPEERAAAQEALRQIGGPVDNNRLRGVLADSKSSYADKKDAVAALAKSGTAEDLDCLLRFAEKVIQMPPPRSDDMLTAAGDTIVALIERRDPKAIAWILDFIQRKDLDQEVSGEVRISTIRALGQAGVREAQAALTALLNDEGQDLKARQYAARALAELDPSRKVEYLKRSNELRHR